MNRSILIVICDFLLVSLLVFSSPDINRVTNEGAERVVNVEVSTNQTDSGHDLAAVMRLALDEERKNRERLLGELAKTRDGVSEREQQVQTFQQALQTKEQQFAAAQTNIQSLNRQLQSSSTEALLSKEKLAAMEAEMRRQQEQAAAREQQIAQLSKSNQWVLAERQRLAGQLQVAEVEKRHATEQATRMQEQVKIEREEKAKLVEGVKTLAAKSGELAQEIRENRPLASNTIFNDFATNRVQARFTASRPGLIGESTKRKEGGTLLVTDGTNTFALCHVQDTPLTFSVPGTEWEGITGTLSRGSAVLPIRSLSFCWPDPRVLSIPVTLPEARQLGCKIYHISSDPYKFQDAVLVGAGEGYYGECKFQIDLTTPGYVKLDNSFLKGLFGKFNPSRGDLVFSKTGELLGVMANNSYCMMFQKFDSAATFRLGQDVRDQHTGATLSQLYSFVLQLPAKLQ